MTLNSVGDQELIEGFLSIFTDCMQATSTDQALVIFDESTQRFVRSIDLAAASIGLNVVFIFIPQQYQERVCDLSRSEGYAIDSQLPRALQQALFESTVILNITSGQSSLAAFRRSIVHQNRRPEARFAHVPGINEQVVTTLRRSPIEQIVSSCELFAWLLGSSQTADVITKDIHGREYQLSMALGGWSNEPMMSPGKILRGSWGNVPPGETFTCPLANTASGQLCVDGSALDNLLSPERAAVLTFEAGRLISWTDVKEAGCAESFERLSRAAILDNDDNWNCLAELGIGLNPAINMLTGNPLFDEKALGSLHVAIGDNTGFGRSVASRRHDDLVVRNPILLLDGVVVVNAGLIDFDGLQAYRMRYRIPTRTWADGCYIRLKESDIEIIGSSTFRRLYSEGRVNYVEISGEGNDSFYLITAELLKCAQEIREVSLLDLGIMTGLSSSEVGEAISRLSFYDAVEWSTQ